MHKSTTSLHNVTVKLLLDLGKASHYYTLYGKIFIFGGRDQTENDFPNKKAHTKINGKWDWAIVRVLLSLWGRGSKHCVH